MSKSQTALYGELLTNEQLYRRDVGQVPKLTPEEEQQVIDRARLGDEQAREQVICLMLPRIVPMAIVFGRIARYADWLDLCQIASIGMLEWLPRALEVERPLGYLYRVARRAVTEYLAMDDSLVRKKCDKDYALEHVVMLSLDVPTERGEGETWADVLVAPVEEVPPPPENSFVQLYQAIEALTERQQEVIKRNFGLFGLPEELLCDIDRDVTGRFDPKMRTASGRKHKALAALRRQFEPVSA